MYNQSTTRIIMAALHLYPKDFDKDLSLRINHPYKSPVIEFGIDMNAIKKEYVHVKGIIFIKSFFIFFVFTSGFLIFLKDPEKYWIILICTLIINSIIELLYLQSSKVRAQDVLEEDYCHSESEESVNIQDPDNPNKNVIIFGGYSPFIGAGYNIDNWSFTVDLSKKENDTLPIDEISTTEIHHIMEKELKKLNLYNVTVTNNLFINGRDINILPQFIPDGRISKPIDFVNERYMLEKLNHYNEKERYYSVIYISMWDKHIVLSMYYKYTILDDTLFAEAKFFILPPIKSKYLNIKNIPSDFLSGELSIDVLKSIFVASYSWIIVIWEILLFFLSGGPMINWFRHMHWKREIEINRLYNYGWPISLREQWSSSSYEYYFQEIDQDFSLKILTSKFLSILLNLLSEKNISTEQFKQASTKIINEGIIVSGGEIKADSFAVGSSARVTKMTMSNTPDRVK